MWDEGISAPGLDKAITAFDETKNSWEVQFKEEEELDGLLYISQTTGSYSHNLSISPRFYRLYDHLLIYMHHPQMGVRFLECVRHSVLHYVKKN